MRANFSSITFFDDEAIKEPGYEWEYTITTKYGTERLFCLILSRT